MQLSACLRVPCPPESVHTFWSPFLGAFPQELQEEVLSWEAALFHMPPSSSSH